MIRHALEAAALGRNTADLRRWIPHQHGQGHEGDEDKQRPSQPKKEADDAKAESTVLHFGGLLRAPMQGVEWHF